MIVRSKVSSPEMKMGGPKVVLGLARLIRSSLNVKKGQSRPNFSRNTEYRKVYKILFTFYTENFHNH